MMMDHALPCSSLSSSLINPIPPRDPSPFTIVSSRNHSLTLACDSTTISSSTGKPITPSLPSFLPILNYSIWENALLSNPAGITRLAYGLAPLPRCSLWLLIPEALLPTSPVPTVNSVANTRLLKFQSLSWPCTSFSHQTLAIND